jgi:hypothetical protein
VSANRDDSRCDPVTNRVTIPGSACQPYAREMIDLYHLHQEAEPTDRTAVEAVVDHVTAEIERLEAAQDLILETSGWG